jgi:hypothetical protein
MATVNVSVTESITISPDDLVGGTPVTYSIDNPLGYSSYIALETTRNADGFYDSTSPQNISGSFSLGNGIIDIVNDNYKVGVIVASGGGELVFTPANNVVSSSLLLRGTGWSGAEYSSGGIGSDGPLSGATVTARGTSVTTNELGEFVFPFELGPTEEITITGGTDSITGLAFEGELKGYLTPTVKVVSPLTTLAFYNEEAESFDEALDSVIITATNLGFTGISKDILTEDYVKKSVEENDNRAIALQAFTTYVDSIAEASAPALKGVKTRYGTLSTDKDAKIAMYKSFGRAGNISIQSFIRDEEIELDDTKNTILSNVSTAIESVLKTELTNVINDNFADGNYRTTRIQGINRNIKNNIKTQVKSAVDSRSADLVKTRDSDITTLLTTTQTELRQVKAGVENKITRVVDDSKQKSFVEVTNLFKEITFLFKGVPSTYKIQNIYALTTDLQVRTKLYVKDTESNTYYSMDDVVTIKVEGERGTQDVSCLAWALTNRENQPQSEVAGFESVTLPSTLDEGATAYFLDSTGVITTIKTKK